jgi:uncharacterized protein with HEPN domain
MINERDLVLINHILDAANAIEAFTSGMSLVDFVEDDLTGSAVVKKLEIIGEAATKLSETSRNELSIIPWKDIVGMRNILIHDYIGIDYEIVWNTIDSYLPKLKTVLSKYAFEG